MAQVRFFHILTVFIGSVFFIFLPTASLAADEPVTTCRASYAHLHSRLLL